MSYSDKCNSSLKKNKKAANGASLLPFTRVQDTYDPKIPNFRLLNYKLIERGRRFERSVLLSWAENLTEKSTSRIVSSKAAMLPFFWHLASNTPSVFDTSLPQQRYPPRKSFEKEKTAIYTRMNFFKKKFERRSVRPLVYII